MNLPSPAAPGNAIARRLAAAPALWLALALFLPAATVYHPRAGWNANTRLALIFAVVDQGRLAIDDYHDLEPYATGDKAFYGGHYYSDKIPGLALLGLAPYAALKAALGWRAPGYPLAHAWIRVWAVSALAAAAGIFLWRAFRRLGLRPGAAAALTQLAFFGTLLFPYATVFYPYLPGIFFLLLAWDRLETWFGGANGARPAAAARTADLRRAFFYGALLSLALLMDYIFGIAALALGLRALWLWRGAGAGRWAARAACAAAGGAIAPGAFALYCHSIFGAFSIPYAYEADTLFREQMARGFMGVRRFQAAALYYLTVHPYRGVFFWSPLLAAALAGAARLALAPRREGEPPAREDFRRWTGALALALTAAYLVFNASYWQWWGGWAMGSRFLLPMTPLLALGLAGLWTWGAAGRAVALLAGAVSALLILPVALVDPQTPMWFHKTEELLRPAISRNLAPEQFAQWRAFWRGGGAPALGSALGLPGPWALLPTLALWAAANAGLRRALRLAPPKEI